MTRFIGIRCAALLGGVLAALCTNGAEGFYRIEVRDERQLVVSPDGVPFTVLGVNHVGEGTNSVSILKGCGFNTLGGGSHRSLYHRGLAHTEFLGFDSVCYMADSDRYIRKATGGPMTAFPNVFHPQFPAFCDALAKRRCAPCRDDRDLLGYFLDNELAWWGKGDLDEGLYDFVATLPDEHSAKRELLRFTGKREVTHKLKASFLVHAAECYFKATTEAVRRHDPNHLILGCRFAGTDGADDAVWRVAGKYCDIMSLNIYPFADLAADTVACERGGEPVSDIFKHYADISGRPILVSEWSFPAMDTGRKCRIGAGQRMPTQKERVAAAELFVKTMLTSPHVIGHNFFTWKDQPIDGMKGANPEDCNYGLVTEGGKPYDALCRAFASVHAKTASLSEGAQTRHCMEFSDHGGKWRLANSAGIVLEGATNGPLIASISRGGYHYGEFNAMIELGRPIAWLDTARTTSVRYEREGTVGVLSLTAETKSSNDRVCEVTCTVTLRSEAHEVEMAILRVANVGTRRLRLLRAYMSPRSPWKTPTAENETFSTTNTPHSAFWRFADGHRWGMKSNDPALNVMNFKVSPTMWQHADAGFVPQSRTYLDAGEAYSPPSPWRGTLLLE